jgi:hypothetical protein
MKMITNRQYYEEQHQFIFGVFCKGKLVFSFNKAKCSHAVAAIIVALLDLAKESLEPGHYFACDFIKELK